MAFEKQESAVKGRLEKDKRGSLHIPPACCSTPQAFLGTAQYFWRQQATSRLKRVRNALFKPAFSVECYCTNTNSSSSSRVALPVFTCVYGYFVCLQHAKRLLQSLRQNNGERVRDSYQLSSFSLQRTWHVDARSRSCMHAVFPRLTWPRFFPVSRNTQML